MDLGRFRITEKRVVAAHIIIINWLAQERGRPFEEKLLSLERFPELVQTEPSMEKSGAAVWRDLAKLPADCQSARPSFLPHQMMETQLEDFRLILRWRFDRI